MFFTYILSDENGKWYYGFTENIQQRIAEHNSKRGGKFTRTRGQNWRLIFLRPFESKTEALQFERKLKSLRNKAFIKKQFSQCFILD